MIHAQAPTKALAGKMVQFLNRVCYVRTDAITRNNEPLFKLVLLLILGRGSIILSYWHKVLYGQAYLVS